MTKEIESEGSVYLQWMYPKVGTCGEGMDYVRIATFRVMAIPDIIIQFDGSRNGFVISGSFPKEDDSDIEIRQVAFIPAWSDSEPFSIEDYAQYQ